MAEAVVGIVMGSDSDWPLVKKACETLDKFGVPYETRVISAHTRKSSAPRSPRQTTAFINRKQEL